MNPSDKSSHQGKTRSAMSFSPEPQAETSASTAHPSLAPGADSQPSDHEGNGVQFEAPRDDGLMRRYNR